MTFLLLSLKCLAEEGNMVDMYAIKRSARLLVFIGIVICMYAALPAIAYAEDLQADGLLDRGVESGIGSDDSGQLANDVSDGEDTSVSETDVQDESFGIQAANGWVHNDGYRYYYENGCLAKGARSIAGMWYYFNLQDGRMLTGSQYLDGNWYRYHVSEGYMLFGSQYIDGNWYRYDPMCGYMLFGSQCIDGNWYRYDPVCGYMLFGSHNIDGNWYRYDAVFGWMLFGSQNIDGAWYRYDTACGYMLFGFQILDNQRYYYDAIDGKMKMGKATIDGKKYRFHARCGYEVPYFRLFLDAGHGWNSSYQGNWDCGAIGEFQDKKIYEANLTSALVDDVAKVCREKYGLEVVTHTDKSSVNYAYRQNQAVDEGCSTFVSIHFNAVNGTKSGFESYIHSYSAPTGSSRVQSVMHSALGKGLGLPDRGKLKGAFAVTGGSLPAVLLETCYIDNAVDIKEYYANRNKLVDSLAAGVYELSKVDECIGSGR